MITEGQAKKIYRDFQVLFKGQSPKIEEYSLSDLRDADARLGSRDEMAGYRMAIRNRISELEEQGNNHGSRIYKIVSVAASVATIVATTLLFYQWVTEPSLSEVLTAFLDDVDHLPKDEVSSTIYSIANTLENASEMAVQRGITDIPPVFLPSKGIKLHPENMTVQFKTPSNRYTVFSGKFRSGNVYGTVDGIQGLISDGVVISSSRDPACRYVVSDINRDARTMSVQFVCEVAGSDQVVVPN